MKIGVSYLLILFFTAANAWPCVNANLPVTLNEFANPTELRAIMDKDFTAEGKKIEKQLRNVKDFNKRNDYAIALMYLHRSQEAVTLLRSLEKKKPGQYSTAANLGTALELSGDNKNAKYWIEKSIRRNSAAHVGTEWLHVRILEAKIAAAGNRHYFETNTILNLPGTRISPEINIGSRKLPVGDVAKALQFQLAERMKLVKPTDAVVASLLCDYAAIEMAAGQTAQANDLLALAARYGCPKAKLATIHPMPQLEGGVILKGAVVLPDSVSIPDPPVAK